MSKTKQTVVEWQIVCFVNYLGIWGLVTLVPVTRDHWQHRKYLEFSLN